ncbi:hypothetical protein NMG60_11018444 [Bertholletia excelsa]
MYAAKRLLLLLLLIMMTTAIFKHPGVQVQAGAMAPQFPQKYSKVFSSLGLVCKCCDGVEGGECRSTWEGPCTNLRCAPWKYHL